MRSAEWQRLLVSVTHSQTSGVKLPHQLTADCDSLRVDDFELSRSQPNHMQELRSQLSVLLEVSATLNLLTQPDLGCVDVRADSI